MKMLDKVFSAALEVLRRIQVCVECRIASGSDFQLNVFHSGY